MLVDFQLDRRAQRTACEVILGLQLTYPRTPVVVHTAHRFEDVTELVVAREGFVAVSADHVSTEWATRAGALANAVLGGIRPPGEPPILVMDPGKLDADVVEALDGSFFRAWDEHCIERRRWLLLEAGPAAPDLSEHLLCTLDAYFDSVPHAQVAAARGVAASTLSQNLKTLRDIFDGRRIDALKAAWEVAALGRGARRRARSPWRDSDAPRGDRRTREPRRSPSGVRRRAARDRRLADEE